MRILFVLPSLSYNGAGKEAWLLASGLGSQCTLRVRALSGPGAWAAVLRAAGAEADRLDGAWALWRLRRLVRAFNPERIHVWRLPALRAVALAAPGFLSRCIVSQALHPCGAAVKKSGVATAAPSLVERWLLRRVRCIVAGGAAEAQSLTQFGFGPDHICIIPPGVEPDGSWRSARAGAGAPTQAESGGRRIVCVGSLHAHKGYREALRAADYLGYSFADLRLQVIGDGPYLASLQRFHEGVFHGSRLHLVGSRADAAAWLAGADVCWVPSLGATGRHVALEAMAAGRPIVASDVPELREVIVDGESGILVPPGRPTVLAQRTRQLLLDEGWRRRLGEEGRPRARAHFAAADFVARHGALYGLPLARTWQGVLPSSPRAAEPVRGVANARDDFSVATAMASRNNAKEEAL